ncbi:alpha/beta hydrolase [uncultured Clostridium sp.]|uniref:alpha/beta hydrolase n=1 Tax=uncultured Clostridium sp. TaxID=59620 RepID=UPI0028F0E882|nr:alpha/beta hydrolase [uncultured Clostridium sp.]
MKTKAFTFKAIDGARIFVYQWLPDNIENAKGVVQIAHGMAEHAKRYERFAKELVQEGYIVYANDHRGHGRTAANEDEIGFFGEENGWNLVLSDFYRLSIIIQEKHSELPHFVFGHSMGSFITRVFIQKYNHNLKGVVICGTGMKNALELDMGRLLAKAQGRIHGKNKRSILIDKLSFGKFNSSFQENRTISDWLTRDEKEVDKYIEDPLCGKVPTHQFFCDLFQGIKEANGNKVINNTPKSLPILMISGDSDPVGGNGRDVIKLYNLYRKAGVKDISLKLYKDARHELLNEINRDEISRDIIMWLNNHI